MKKHDSVFFLLFFVILFLLSWKMLTNGFVANYFTHSSVWPEKLLAIDLLKSGKFPLWNPYILNGVPLFANMQVSVLYPLNLLFFVFDKTTAIKIYVYLPFVMGFGFVYLFLKTVLTSKVSTVLGCTVGAAIFALIIFLVGKEGAGSFGHTLVWLPLILYFIEKYLETKRLIYGCLISICLTFSIFAGDISAAIIVYLVSAVYILIRCHPGVTKGNDRVSKLKSEILSSLRLLQNDKLWKLFLFILLSMLLSAIQIVPFIEMYQNSTDKLFGNEALSPFSPKELQPNPNLITKLQELTKDGKSYGYLPNNTNVTYKIFGSEGTERFYNKNLAEIVSLFKIDRTRIFNLLSDRYLVSTDGSSENTEFSQKYKSIWHDGNVNIYINNFSLDNARLAYSYVVPATKQQMFNSLTDKNFDISKSVFLDKNIGKLKEGRKGTITKISESETEKKYFVDGQLDGMLVLSDVYYPGWRVYIDDEEQELLKVNNAFMGVKLREGKNNIQFIYNSNTIKLAAIMSFIGIYILGFLAIFAVVEIWKKK